VLDRREAVTALAGDVRVLVEAALAVLAVAGGLPALAVAVTAATAGSSFLGLVARLARLLGHADLLAVSHRQQRDDDLAKVSRNLLHRPAQLGKRRKDRLGARLLRAILVLDRLRLDD